MRGRGAICALSRGLTILVDYPCCDDQARAETFRLLKHQTCTGGIIVFKS